jgi:hypothetical protein
LLPLFLTNEEKLMSEEYYNGEFENVRLCHIENSDFAFLWGYVVEHNSHNFV